MVYFKPDPKVEGESENKKKKMGQKFTKVEGKRMTESTQQSSGALKKKIGNPSPT